MYSKLLNILFIDSLTHSTNGLQSMKTLRHSTCFSVIPFRLTVAFIRSLSSLFIAISFPLAYFITNKKSNLLLIQHETFLRIRKSTDSELTYYQPINVLITIIQNSVQHTYHFNNQIHLVEVSF